MSHLLLFPGSSGGRDQSTLVALEKGLRPAWKTVRAEFPYRTEGRRVPDRQPVLLRTVRDAIAKIRDDRIVVGGRSMGGRICSMVAAGADGEPAPPNVCGLVAISYPLHPPGKPHMLRSEHLATITVPCLFISGDRDPFASPEELEHWTATIPGPVTHHWFARGRHDLRGLDADVVALVKAWLTEL